MERKEQEELAELHDHLNLHDFGTPIFGNGRCKGCGVRSTGSERYNYTPHPILVDLIPDVQYKVEFGEFTEGDKRTVDRLFPELGKEGATGISNYAWQCMTSLKDTNQNDLKRFMVYRVQLDRYLAAHPEIVPFGEKPLSELAVVRHRLKVRMDTTGVVHCDAYTPKRLGWSRMGHTEGNITSGNKATVYQHADGRIAIFHHKKLTALSQWKQRCKTLTLLLIKLYGTKEILKQAGDPYLSFVERYDATGVFVE